MNVLDHFPVIISQFTASTLPVGPGLFQRLQLVAMFGVVAMQEATVRQVISATIMRSMSS
jgi:hypothetical protein